MSTKIEIRIPWERYGAIAYIADNVEMFGKTALQKMVYFLQEWKGVSLGYRFEFYTYGPFSAALMGDLDYADVLGAVKVQYIVNGGYSISPGPQNEDVRKHAQDFLDKHKAEIDAVINVFGRRSATSLELFATTHYAYSYFAARGKPVADSDVIDTVHALKPGKFSRNEITEALEYLRTNQVITA
ncbi:MAG: restriction endonuclease [Armatimonadota bacterium]|nr:restriction endonuclease [Armatimonadota bacterium]